MFKRRRSLLLATAAAMVTGRAWARPVDAGPIVLGQVALSFYAVTGTEEVTRLYEGAHFFWAVPDYVPASEVSTIADLAKPGVVARMNKRIQGIGAGAGITVRSRQALGDYGLDAAGYALQPGSANDWIAAYEKARTVGEWMVFPTWAPQYLNRDGKLRPLRDPRGTLGSVNHASLVGHSRRLQALPPATRLALSKVKLGIEAVTEMDYLVNVGKHTPQKAARIWMDNNESIVASWLEPD